MISMLRVAVVVVEIVDVVAVLHRLMAAVGSPVAVLVDSMFGRLIVFVIMVVVLRMTVAIVQIVGVVTMLHCFVTAVRSAMAVVLNRVLGFDFLGHDISFR